MSLPSSPEHLHNLNVPGVPPQKLRLKPGALAILTRNIKFGQGLINGQKGIVHGVTPNARGIQVELLTPERQIVLAPRNTFHAKVGRSGISFQMCTVPFTNCLLVDSRRT